MKNEKTKDNYLIVIESIDKRLQQKRNTEVFPLSPTHRKELRELKNRNIGELNTRLRDIKKLKREEYFKKYSEEIKKEFQNKEQIVERLNNNWIVVLKKINSIIEDRKKFESSFDLENMDINTGYSSVSHLSVIDESNSNFRRRISFNADEVSLNISKDEFNKKYGKAFDGVQKIIDTITTQYEEAINFGDVEIVKELYYKMKSSDGIFKKISEIKI